MKRWNTAISTGDKTNRTVADRIILQKKIAKDFSLIVEMLFRGYYKSIKTDRITVILKRRIVYKVNEMCKLQWP